jgi:hypothetical protein
LSDTQLAAIANAVWKKAPATTPQGDTFAVVAKAAPKKNTPIAFLIWPILKYAIGFR